MMRKWLAVLITLAITALGAVACGGIVAPQGSSGVVPDGTNFRLLISDEPNAIGDFTELNVTITRIGVQQGGESGSWEEWEIEPAETVDLTVLQGTNSTEIWSGELEDGTYNKVFIYVSEVVGTLTEEVEGEPTVRLPSGKLQVSKPFDVASGEITDFVFDITVIKTGADDKYILKPQITDSGSDQEITEVDAQGRPQDTGKPEGVGKPDKPGKQNGEEFTGTILELVDDDTWLMEIDGAERTVVVTGAEMEGTPDVGLRAEVEGTVNEEEEIVAIKVEVDEATE
jgi:hypothetical protein